MRSTAYADINLCRVVRCVAVVELGDVALAERMAETTKAARALGDRHPENRFTFFAELRAFGDVPQPIEVNVRAADHGDQVLAAHTIGGSGRTF